MAQMDRSDAELTYRYMTDAVRDDVESEAFNETLEMWQAERPEDLEALEEAHDDESSFAWESIDFETSPDHDGDLVPITGVQANEFETVGLAKDFAWDYLKAIRDAVRDLQESTTLSPREFVTLTLDAADDAPEDVAHREMDISLGNYRGKKGKVSDKMDAAKKTIQISERLRS